MELSISCQTLKDADTFSKSDPRVRVAIVDASSHRVVKNLGTTETIMNNLNPVFNKKVACPHFLPPTQILEFVVTDSDATIGDSLGKAYMTLESIRMGGMAGCNMMLGKGNGRITVTGHQGGMGKLQLTLRGAQIKSVDFLSKSIPL